MYIELCGRWSTMKLWRAEQRAIREEGIPRFMDPVVEQEIISKEKGPFSGFIMFASARLSTKARRKLFSLTFSMRFHGLSIMGQEILAKHGFALKPTQFQEMERQALDDARQRVRFAS